MLSGQKVEILAEAIKDGYRSKSQLQIVIRERLDTNLDSVAGGENLSEIVFNLIDWADRYGKLNQLVDAVVCGNPKNDSLSKLTSIFGETCEANTESASISVELNLKPDSDTDIQVKRLRIHERAKVSPNSIFVGRKDQILQAASILRDSTWGIYIWGIGGIGKTEFAKQLAHIVVDGDHEFNEVLFSTAQQFTLAPNSIIPKMGGQATLNGIINDLIHELEGEERKEQLYRLPLAERLPRLQECIAHDSAAGSHKLLIIDNIETLSKEEQGLLISFLQELPSTCKAIVTSRIASQMENLPKQFGLNGLDKESTLELIHQLAETNQVVQRRISTAEDSELEDFFVESAGSPLRVEWMLGLLRREELSVSELLRKVQSRPIDYPHEKYLFEAFTFSLEELFILKSLANLPIPLAHNSLQKITLIAPAIFTETLAELREHALILSDETRNYSLHPIARHLARNTPITDESSSAEIDLTLQLEEQSIAYWTSFIGDNAFRGGIDEEKKHNFKLINEQWANLYTVLLNWHDSSHDTRGHDSNYFSYNFIWAVNSLGEFLHFYGYWEEHQDLFEKAFDKALWLGEHIDQEMLSTAGWLAYGIAWLHGPYLKSDSERLGYWNQKYREYMELTGNEGGIVESERLDAYQAMLRDEREEAFEILKQVKEKYEALDHEDSVSHVLNDIGELALTMGRLDEAREALTLACEYQHKCGSHQCIASVYGNLGNVEVVSGNFQAAKEHFNQQISYGKKAERFSMVAHGQFELAKILAENGSLERALELATNAAPLSKQSHSRNFQEICDLIDELSQKINGG